MRINNRIGVVMALALLAGAPSAFAVVPAKEELKNCPLPHGEVQVPVAGSFEAATGEFVKLADGTTASSPAIWQTRKLEDVTQMAAKHDADLAFIPDDGGTLWAISGRVVDLGAKYLWEAAEMKLDRPEPIPGASHKAGGMIKGIDEGRTYLVETTEGKFALVRVLEINKAGMRVQYVFQPSGAIQFDVKPGDLTDVMRTAPLTSPAKRPEPATIVTTQPAPAPALPTTAKTPDYSDLTGGGPRTPVILEPPFSNHVKQRNMMIETRMKVLRASAKTAGEIDRKVDAIDELVQLHADEAAGDMVKQLTFLNPRGAGKEFQDSVHPCFAALKKLGKAGSSAALKGLKEMDLAQESEGLDSPSYKAGLLALVVRAVEGDDVTLYIFRRERDATKDPTRRAMYERLINPSKE